jgi:hypothetical protein
VECVSVYDNILCGAVCISHRPIGWNLVWLCGREKPRVYEEMPTVRIAVVRLVLYHTLLTLDYVNTTCYRNLFCAATTSFFRSMETTLQCIIGSITAQKHTLETTDSSFH